MTFAQTELRKSKIAYEAAVRRWYAARDAGDLVSEEDERERAAGVRWKPANQNGRAALGAFQLAKSNLDHWSAVVQREAGDESCPQCTRVKTFQPGAPRLESIPMEEDRRLPPEHEDATP